MSFLHDLCTRRAIPARVAVVVAHPDDETIAAGARLHLMPHLLLIHVNDGAPRCRADANREGFPTPDAYAAARELELQAALSLAGVTATRSRLGIPDQDASLHMPAIASRLRHALHEFRAEIVLTHAYEGGHPDHDAVACAVHRAASCPVFEFAGYHAGPDRDMTVQRFLPGPPGTKPYAAETRIGLDPEEQAHKRAMLDCFTSQRDLLSRFGVSVERYRPAPRYDFTRPPHEGPLNYENWGWDMDGARWRLLAGALQRVAYTRGAKC